MAFSDFLETGILNHLFRTASLAKPAGIFVALFTVAPTDAGGGTEVAGGAYARQSAAPADANWTAPGAPGLTDNVFAITFPAATLDWGEILAVAIFDAVTAGNFLAWHWLSTASKFFTVPASTDVFTSYAHGLTNNVKVILRGDLPTGVTADTVYFVINVTTDTFQLSTTFGGGAINLTTDGGGKVHRLNPKTVQIGDTLRINVGALDVVVD